MTPADYSLVALAALACLALMSASAIFTGSGACFRLPVEDAPLTGRQGCAVFIIGALGLIYCATVLNEGKWAWIS